VERASPEAQDLTELSLDRIQAWLALLEKQKPGMEEPLYPWIQLAGSDLAQEWGKLQSRYADETRSRAVYNREKFRPFGDMARDGFGGWYADGNAAMDGPSPSGEFAVASSGPAAVTGVFPAGIYTHALSERLDAALRSPLVPKDKKFLSLRVVGGRMGAWRPSSTTACSARTISCWTPIPRAG
jgi:hypothetical protein